MVAEMKDAREQLPFFIFPAEAATSACSFYRAEMIGERFGGGVSSSLQTAHA
jgi:hypothetical protein